jgi:predicted aldo/keto reductase-like oxidoreductase
LVTCKAQIASKKNQGKEEKLKTVKLSGTNLEVSEVGFGGIPIIPLPKKEAVSIVKYCFDLGITFFDTANMYLTSEEKIGGALEPVRDKAVIASKTTQRDAKGAAAHIDTSLKQLKTDWIDIYQCHNVSNQEALQQILAPQGAYEALAKARDAGKIRFIGISSHSIPTALEALQTGLFQTLQFPFNFIENDPENELFPFACQHNVGIIGMKPLGGGLLESADLCFGFLQQHPYVVPIPGIRAKKEADQITALYRHPQPLSRSDLKKMQKIQSVLGEKFCHRCEYCMPCEQGVQIPSVLIFPAAAKRLSPEGVSAWLGKAMESVAECIECGQCEEKCPYNLPIADLLKENLALFKKIRETKDLSGT